MNKTISLLLVLCMLASLTGCGSSGSESENTTTAQAAVETEAESHETLAEIETIVEETQTIETEAETPDYDDPSWTPPEAADPIISAKHNNPEDDPRMIVQEHWGPGDFAFIDQYNLIGYSDYDTNGKDGADYFFDENADYIPESSGSYKQFFTPPADDDPAEVLGYIDVEGWVNSFNIDNVSILSDPKREVLVIEFSDSAALYITHIENISYSTSAGGQYGTEWRFHNCADGYDSLYGIYDGEKYKIASDMRVLWIIEQGLNAVKNNSTENPW